MGGSKFSVDAICELLEKYFASEGWSQLGQELGSDRWQGLDGEIIIKKFVDHERGAAKYSIECPDGRTDTISISERLRAIDFFSGKRRDVDLSNTGIVILNYLKGTDLASMLGGI